VDGKIRLSQLYELQRVALINVHYYAARISGRTKWNRGIQILTALLASGALATIIKDLQEWKLLNWSVPAAAAVVATVAAILNLTDSISRLERMHSAYKMLYHSAENLAKQTIGLNVLTAEQACAVSMLEAQLAALGPQDEIDPDEKAMKKAQERVEQQLPDSYYYPQSA